MITVKILKHASTFAEDKDVAARIRDDIIRPALERHDNVRLDFSGVDGATQSFIHAMVSDLIRTRGPNVLKNLEFRACNPTIRSVVEIVAEYSQLEEPAVAAGAPPKRRIQRPRQRQRDRTNTGSAGERRISGRPPRRPSR